MIPKSNPTQGASPSGPKIVVIGAGCGGLAFAIALQRKYGYQNYVIYEKESDLGGTWRNNTYPGCSSDVGMHFFSLSTDLRNWSSTHAPQPAILSYWRDDLALKYGILPHIQFHHEVLSATWVDADQAYDVKVKNNATGMELEVVKAQIVVSAIGVLDVPCWPGGVPGLAEFKGTMFHSARWDHGVELNGKRVAIIGNGPSAIQILPQISSDPLVQVTNFIRTPSWFFPSGRKTYSPVRLWLTRAIPGVLWILRFFSFLKHELLYLLVFSNSITRKLMQLRCKAYLKAKAPKASCQQLMPKHDLGCKRILFDTGYLDSLHRPNVSLCFDGIKQVVEDGIITDKGHPTVISLSQAAEELAGDKIPFDVIIMATGFVTDDFPIPIKGKNGLTVSDYYRLSGGPTAYLGTSIPGFPNFYTLLGPNIATGFTSVIYSHELQIDYILQLIQPILHGNISSFNVMSQATDEYNANLQKRLSGSVFTQCVSWYRTGRNGKVSNVFPGSGILMWWWLRRPVREHYEVAVGQRCGEERKAGKRQSWVLEDGVIMGVLVLALGFAYKKASARYPVNSFF